SFKKAISEKSRHAVALLRRIAERDLETRAHVRGRGLIQALIFAEADTAKKVSEAAFERGVIIETCGPRDEALKLLPSLTISREELELGISIIAESVRAVQDDASVRIGSLGMSLSLNGQVVF